MIPVLKFAPYFKEVLWGGNRIAAFKNITLDRNDIGESWELSPMPGHESVIKGGKFSGMKITDLIDRYPAEILGEKVNKTYDGKFPLLVKFIDSNDDLSIQVHPDDVLAKKKHNSLGKTEMWYAIAPAEDATLFMGFNRPMDPETLRKMIADNTVTDSLTEVPVKKGDFFFIPAGRVHAIRKGNLLVEIQEASDVTYRLYDFDRRDSNGNPRELHIEDSIEAINYNDIPRDEFRNSTPAKGEELKINSCPYFSTTVINVDGEFTPRLYPNESFTILIALGGSLTITDNEGNQTTLRQGETALVPASIPSVTLTGEGTVMTVHI